MACLGGSHYLVVLYSRLPNCPASPTTKNKYMRAKLGGVPSPKVGDVHWFHRPWVQVPHSTLRLERTCYKLSKATIVQVHHCTSSSNTQATCHQTGLPMTPKVHLPLTFQENIATRGVTPSLINAYMCAQDLFIRGLFTLEEKIIRYVIFQNKGKCLYFNTPYQSL